MRRGLKSAPGSLMTLGNAAANHVRIAVWYKACQHRVDPDPAEMVSRHRARPCSTVAKGDPAAPPFRRAVYQVDTRAGAR